MPPPMGLRPPVGNSAAKTKLTAAFESYLRSDVPELGLKALPEAKKAPKAK